MIIEACVESIKEAHSAEQNGAHRIEVCSRLDLEGLTPPVKFIQTAISSLSIPIKVMIRPRGGNFIYTRNELSTMEGEIEQCKSIGVPEVVFGVLDHQNRINIDVTTRLAQLATPMKVTFHKAIDRSTQIIHSLEKLKSIKEVNSILTSGGYATAVEGKNVIKKMIQIAGDKLTIIPAGKITNQNLHEVHNTIGASEYHGRRIVGELS